MPDLIECGLHLIDRSLLCLFYRTFSARHFTYTDTFIAVAQAGSDEIIDAIPLFEVEEVINMNFLDSPADAKLAKGARPPAEEDTSKTKKCGDSNKVKFRNSIQIRTCLDGYNSGRKYYFQTDSDEKCSTLVDDLNRLSKIALEKFLAKSRFIKAQELVKGYYTTTECRILVALLIIAV
jgi:hypothetical protein